MKSPKIKDIGDANAWSFFGTPDIVKQCQELGHELIVKNEGNCLNRYTCPKCKYTYLVDSSG